MSYFEKARSSRPLRTQTLNYAGSGTAISTTFASQTYQIRVWSQVAGYWSVVETKGHSALYGAAERDATTGPGRSRSEFSRGIFHGIAISVVRVFEHEHEFGVRISNRNDLGNAA